MALKLNQDLARASELEDQCGPSGGVEECQTPLTSLRSAGQNASVKAPYELPAGAMWGREYPFSFDDTGTLNRRLRIDLLTHQKETALGLRQGSLRPVIRYLKFAARVGPSAGGAFVSVGVQVSYVNQAAPGAADLANTDIAPIFSGIAPFGYFEGPGRLGFGCPENGDGWYDCRIIVLAAVVPGVTGNIAVRLGWELKPAGAAAP